MSRYDARVRKLEELQGAGDGTPCAVVRYTPSESTGWWPLVEASLGFPFGRVALVIVDARDDAALLPEVVVPPVSEDRLTALQAAALASAGQDAGRWWIAIAGRGWTDAMPMHEGETALLSALRAQRNRAVYGHNDDL